MADASSSCEVVAPAELSRDPHPVAGADHLRLRRLGGALACAAWTGFLNAAREIAQHGTFSSLALITGGGMERLVDPRQR